MGRKLPNPIRLTGNYMAEPKRTGKTTIDWSNMKKESTTIDRDGNVIDLPPERPKTLQDLIRRRNARMGRT